jgi:putative spermidine/putrescine transport system substrate-binding protein
MHTISMADEMLCFKPSLRRRIAVAAARANSLRCCGFSRFLTLLINAAFCCSLLLSAPAVAADKVLRVLAWPGYADADVVKTFEARYNAKVEVTLVDSDEALWAQMHAQGTPQFDVLAAGAARSGQFAEYEKTVAAVSGAVVD